MARINHVGVLSFANIFAVMGVAGGLIIGIIFALISAFTESGVYGVWMAIILPIAYGVIGWISGIFSAFIYNLVAGWIGGLEIRFEK